MLHLHCVDDWLDLCVHNLFNDSLDPVMRLSAVGTVCSQLAARFSGFLSFSSSPVLLARRRSVQRLVPRFVPLECWETTSRLAWLDHFNNFLLTLWNWHVNDLLHGAIL